MNKIDVEKDVLGSVLLHFEYADKFLATVKESDFSDARHRYMYKLIEKLYTTNQTAFNITDVYATYPKAIALCGGIEYIAEIIADCISPLSFESHRNSLVKLSTIEAVSKLSKNAEALFKEDFDKGVDYIATQMESIVDRVHKSESVNLYQAFKNSLDPKANMNVDLGFKRLHDIMGYPHPGELMIIGARPGMGKTAFALGCLFNYICTKKKRAIMFSLEMSGSELFSRMISSISKIPLSDIRSQNIPAEAKKVLDDNAKELASNEYLSLYDKSVSNIPALRAAIRKESKKGEVGLVIVDYLQLITGTGNNNYEKVSEISRQLKLIAREFNCTVIALSQLSRKVEDRSDKRPQLADLRESGAIEQDADYVLFLYRHNYYAKDESVDSTKDPLSIEIAKNRHGKTGTIQIEFDLTTGSFQ